MTEYIIKTEGNGSLRGDDFRMNNGFRNAKLYHHLTVDSDEKETSASIGDKEAQNRKNRYSKTLGNQKKKNAQGEQTSKHNFASSKEHYQFESPDSENHGGSVYFNATEKSYKWYQVEQGKQTRNNSYSMTQYQNRQQKEHSFTLGTPEHYQPLANTGSNEKSTADEKPINEAIYASENINENTSKDKKQLELEVEQPRENDVPFGRPFSLKVHGNKTHQNAPFINEEPMKKLHASFNSPSAEINVSPYQKEPIKVMAVGNAVDNSNATVQHKRHGEA